MVLVAGHDRKASHFSGMCWKQFMMLLGEDSCPCGGSTRVSELLDENGFYTTCKAQALSAPPFFDARHGGVPDIVGHSSYLDELHTVDSVARTAVIKDCATGFTWTYPLVNTSSAASSCPAVTAAL